jgi:dipeptidyl-peptidase-4
MTTTRSCFLSLLLTVIPLHAQAPERLTVEWIFSDAGANAWKMPSFSWTSDGEILLLDETKPEGERTFERFTPGTGRRVVAVNPAKSLASLEALLGKQAAPKTLTWPDSVDRTGKSGVYIFGGDLFVLDLSSSTFRRITHTPETESVARLSPDGRALAFVRSNDLYVLDLAAGTEIRVTHDGSQTVKNGALSWVYWEEIFNHDEAGYWWSPDSRAIAFLRSDESPVSEILFPDITPAVPRVMRQRYPKAGGANPLVTLGIVDLNSGATTFVSPQKMPYEYIMGLAWLPDGRRVAVQVTNRMQTRLDLYFIERGTGTPSRILQDGDEGWVNQHELQFLTDGRFVWSSERDGHTHLYLYAADGTLATQLTHGDWSVRGPQAFYSEPLGSTFVDEDHGLVYFTALEKSPIERHLYRVRLDGSGFERLTSEDGVHVVTFSSDRSAWTDVFSSHCTLPTLTVVTTNGPRKTTLATSRADLKSKFDWQCPEMHTVPAGDGYQLQVRLIKPRPFDSTKKYPAIVSIYGGPSAPVVMDSWDYPFASNAPYDQILSHAGYVVMNVDPRSATAASKAIENTVARNLWADGELADMLAGVHWLKAQPWVDASRVGVWGWSGGGTSTLLLMTRSQEFRAGIAVAPNTDWAFYDTKFTEAYMKTPADNPEGYDNTSLIRRAKDLHGRIMLVHGTYDDNVHPQHTFNVVNELIEARKPFDLMLYPMRKHTIDDRPARIDLFNRMLEFWKRNL